MDMKGFADRFKAKAEERVEAEPKAGRRLFDMFSSGERYEIDFADNFTSEGWQQFDTDQDAWYFGVWVNPAQPVTLSYAEGDWTLTECSDVEHYNLEIQTMLDFYGEGRIAVVIDSEGSATEYRQDRSEFLVTS